MRPTAIALGLAALLAAAPAPAQEAPLRIRLSTDIRSTDPGVNRDGPTDGVVAHLVEGLVAMAGDTSVKPMLAERIDVSEDGLTYTFPLRQGVKFHNGAPLTAEDVAFAWARHMKRETNWRCRGDLDGSITRITAIESPDPQTVVFRLEKPSALFLSVMARPDCGSGAIWHRDSLNADGSWRAPVGTGPFRLGEWRRGQYIELTRNPDYAARPGEPDGLAGNRTALVERVRFMIIPDEAAARAALLAGNIDILPDARSRDVEELRGRGFTIHSAASFDLQVVLMQTRDPVLSDVRMRRAVALSLDVPELVRAVTEGGSRASRSPIPVSSAFFTPAMAAVPARDIAAARRLAAEAGYRGQPIKLLTTRRFEAFYEIAVLVQDMAREAGINFELEVLEWATQLDRYTRGDYQAMAFGFSARLDPSLSFEMFTGPKATQPRKAWDDPAAQALLEASMREADPARRIAAFEQLHARLMDQVPVIALYSSVSNSVVPRHVQGYRAWAMDSPRAWGVRLVR
jgi:peptide/nickel transport system substrate-binding protein